MYKNTIKNAGVGVYRITFHEVWPAYINQTLWTIFGMTKADFVRSVDVNNILGGKYDQVIDLKNTLCDNKPFCSKQSTLDVMGLSAKNSRMQLKIIYSTTPVNEDTTLLFFMIWKQTPEFSNYSNIIETLNIYHLVFNELDEIGIEFDKVNQSIKLITAQFCLESCWRISTAEMISSFSRFVYPDDRAHLRKAITSASEKLDYGKISVRVCVLQKEYRKVELWYSSSIGQNGEISRIQGIIGRVPGIKHGERFQYIKFIPQSFRDDKTFLHLEFNMDTNQRIRSESDIEMSFFPCTDYQSTLMTLRNMFLHQQDSYRIDCLMKRFAKMQAKRQVHDFYCCDIRMLSSLDINHTNQANYRWYHVIQELFFDIQSRLTLGVISIYDIDDLQAETESALPLHCECDTMYTLNYDTFIIRFAEYFTAARCSQHSGNDSALALVKINVALGAIGHMEDAVERAMKTIYTVVHKDELFGKQSDNVFAILFHTHNQPESIRERIRMLNTGLTAIENTEYSISADIGYCIMSDSDPNISSLLMERANLSLFWAGLPNHHHIYEYSRENEECIRQTLSASEKEKTPLRIPPKLPEIYIRTLGSFDVFVDGCTIPFSNEKAKELLAVLVDHREGFVTPGQAITYLWEDEPCNKKVLSRLRKVALLLKRQLESYGIADIVKSVNGQRRLVMRHGIQCDYYDLLAGNARNLKYWGTYMPEYSWAESTNAILEANYSFFTENGDALPGIHEVVEK